MSDTCNCCHETFYFDSDRESTGFCDECLQKHIGEIVAGLTAIQAGIVDPKTVASGLLLILGLLDQPVEGV